MKGLELPISTVVIIVIVLIVLLAMIALFFGVYSPSSASTTLQAATTTACQRVRTMGREACGECTVTDDILIDNFDANDDGELNPGLTGDNLRTLCVNYYGADTNSCNDISIPANCDNCVRDCLQRVCDCPAYAS